MSTLQQGLTPKMKPLSPKRSALIAALDVGTSKVACLIGRLKPNPNRDTLRRRSHSIEVLGFGDGPNADMNRESAPAILNATNGKSGAGAVFDYSETLGDLCYLAPGASTRPVIWRFRVQEGAHVPQMSVVVHGH